jgi:hypothetical protein
MNQNSFPPNGDDPAISSLLAELAGEATSKLRGQQTAEEERQARSVLVNEALARIFKFFQIFARHSNDIAPEIQRPYYFDDRTVFTPLKWSNAFADFRKQNLSDAAFIDYVLFRVNLAAPEPVLVSRRWNQLDALKTELSACGMKPLEDLDMLFRKKSNDDVFDVSLAPEFVLKISFHGNYRDGTLDIVCSNLESFGSTSIRLEPEYVDQELLDDLGRYLIGRTNSLPDLFYDEI